MPVTSLGALRKRKFMKDQMMHPRRQYTFRRMFPLLLYIPLLSLLVWSTVVAEVPLSLLGVLFPHADLGAWVSVAEAYSGIRIESIFPSCTAPGSSVTLNGRKLGGS